MSNSEAHREKAGGISYEVILKPAATDSPVRPTSSPPKERPLSQEIISLKLKEAEERRLSLEAAKLAKVTKEEQIAKAKQKVAEQNESFSKESQERMLHRLESMEVKKTQQINALQDRLRDHEKHVQKVLDTSASFSKNTQEKLITKMEMTLKNRESQLQSLMEKLQEHERHIQEVRQNKLNQSSNLCEDTEAEAAAAATGSS